MNPPVEATSPLALIIVVVYLGALLVLGWWSGRAAKGTSEDFFVASHSLGPVVMLLSVFATTMTSFALIGSTSEAYRTGIGVYGMMASWSGLVHAGVFFLVGVPLWAFGKRHGYVTQVQYFRDRFESPGLGMLLFPILVALVVPYVLMGLLSAGSYLNQITKGNFPELFPSTDGGLPRWLGCGVVTLVVMTYIFIGGFRGAAWANVLQTLFFMSAALMTYTVIASKLGGFGAASERVLATHPERMVRGEAIAPLHFFSYCFIPLSVGMFPHLFQQWLTARSARTFRLTVICHPVFIMVLWLPCVMIGVWATAAVMPGTDKLVVPLAHPPNSELAIMISKLVPPFLAGLVSAGILSAIISFDSQFMALGTMFANDVIFHHYGEERFNDKQKIMFARIFIVIVVILSYILSLYTPAKVFKLGVWAFSGFSGLFPLVFASIYWRRVTRAGAFASVIACAIVWLILFRQGHYGADEEYLFLGMEPAAPVVAASTLALVVVSLFTKPPSAATLRKFYPA